MSTREIALNIFNSLDEEQLAAFVTLFKSLEIPNVQTREAINEINSGGGTLFTGSTEELINSLIND